jgi:hypothetical protein
MKKTLLTLVFGLAAAGAASAQTSTVSLRNDSSWVITEMYLSAVDVREWGPDQLGDHVIEPNSSYELHDVPCDVYDVRLVDEDGDVCIVGGVKLCGADSAWKIDDDDLLDCQADTDE